MLRSDALRASLAEALKEEAERYAKYGNDGPDGTVVRFRVRFASSRVKYSYAAIRARGLWWVTGSKSPQGLSWEEFTDWLMTVGKVTKFERWPKTSKKETLGVSELDEVTR